MERFYVKPQKHFRRINYILENTIAWAFRGKLCDFDREREKKIVENQIIVVIKSFISRKENSICLLHRESGSSRRLNEYDTDELFIQINKMKRDSFSK